MSVQFRCTTLGFRLSLGFKNDAIVPYRTCTNGILHLDAPAIEKIRFAWHRRAFDWLQFDLKSALCYGIHRYLPLYHSFAFSDRLSEIKMGRRKPPNLLGLGGIIPTISLI